MMRLEHTFAAARGGTLYRSTMHVGTNAMLARSLLDRCVLPWLFSEEEGPAWLMHNFEEVGSFEFFFRSCTPCKGW